MRVGILSTPWAPVPPPFYGGIEAVVNELARGLAREGHEVVLYTTGDSTCPVPRLSALATAAGQRIGHVDVELYHAIHGYDALARAEVDIIHDHTIAGPILARTRPELRVVTTVHNALEGELADVYRHTALHVPTITISHAQRRSCPDLASRRVIHHGLDLDAVPAGGGQGGYCLFLGRMDPHKGAHRAVRAAELAGMPLILAGKMRTEAEHEYFRTQVEPRLGERVRYEGEVTVERKAHLLGEARCLLFPIRWPEPFGMVMIEALAAGTPVLAFSEGAAPEVVDHGRTGYLCGDEEEMAVAIAKADGLDRHACRAAVAERFSAERMVKDHLALYREILSEPRTEGDPTARSA